MPRDGFSLREVLHGTVLIRIGIRVSAKAIALDKTTRDSGQHCRDGFYEGFYIGIRVSAEAIARVKLRFRVQVGFAETCTPQRCLEDAFHSSELGLWLRLDLPSCRSSGRPIKWRLLGTWHGNIVGIT